VHAYLTNIRMTLRLMLRDRTVLFFNYVFPLIFFFMFGQLYEARQGGIVRQVVNMVLTIGVLGAGLFGAGMRTVIDREANILRRFKVAPVGPWPLVIAGLVTGLIAYIPNLLLTLLLAHYVYGMPWPERPVSMFLFVCLGTLAFRAIGSIAGSVVNSMQESQIVIQLIYFPMLMLSGATIPLFVMPQWLQILANFLPSTRFFVGMQAILSGREGIRENWTEALALLVTTVVGTFLAVKLFRWEKDEKLPARAKAWVLAVLLPFFAMGIRESYARENIVKNRILEREMQRSTTLLIKDARVFTGDGQILEPASVLIRNGRIERVFPGPAPDAKTLNAEEIEAAGRTVLPGLIDVHVHLGAPAGFYAKPEDYQPSRLLPRELAAYLYSGVTAIRSLGDPLAEIARAAGVIASGEKLGAEAFFAGPLFTAAGGHGTEYAAQIPEQFREQFNAQFVRIPKTAEEARTMVRDLKQQGVTAIKVVLEAGVAGHTFERLDLKLAQAVVGEARSLRLPVACHTGDARDVADAVALGATSIEHGSFRDAIPDATFAAMKSRNIAYSPTLAVGEAFAEIGAGSLKLMERSLVAQIGPPELLAATRSFYASPAGKEMSRGIASYPLRLDVARDNLRRAHRAGVTLVTGSDAGNPLVFHGPTVQREIQLWVEAGIPAAVALQAATSNAAHVLGAGDRIGLIKPGYEASLVILDGNPLTDPAATERISTVIFKGGRVGRAGLFDQK
jgi:imidazolonepropionase-like amidohydrolase/ABC-type multidrug transport system permease subunit